MSGLVLSGSGTIAGLQPGGLPDASVQQADLAANVAGNGPIFSAQATANTSVPNGAWTKVANQTVEFDLGAGYSAANGRYQPTVPGYYLITANVSFAGASSGTATCALYKNGSNYRLGSSDALDLVSNGTEVCAIVFLNGTTDYVELMAYQSSGGALNASGGYFQGFLARTA